MQRLFVHVYIGNQRISTSVFGHFFFLVNARTKISNSNCWNPSWYFLTFKLHKRVLFWRFPSQVVKKSNEVQLRDQFTPGSLVSTGIPYYIIHIVMELLVVCCFKLFSSGMGTGFCSSAKLCICRWPSRFYNLENSLLQLLLLLKLRQNYRKECWVNPTQSS